MTDEKTTTEDSRIITPSSSIIEVGKPKGFTTQIIGSLVMERRGKITLGVVMDGPDTCTIHIHEVPMSAKTTKIELHFAKFKPFWWKKKHQRLIDKFTNDMRVQMVAALQRAQKKCQPTGKRTDI